MCEGGRGSEDMVERGGAGGVGGGGVGGGGREEGRREGEERGGKERKAEKVRTCVATANLQYTQSTHVPKAFVTVPVRCMRGWSRAQ